MRTTTLATMACLTLVTLSLRAAPARGEPYWQETWWPSKWGADDERGSFNTLTPDKVLASLRLARSGQVYRLGRPYEASMPKFGSRTYSLHIPGLPVAGPMGSNHLVYNDEFIVGELGQVGTQFDGPGHVGIRGPDGVDRWYNGRDLATAENTYGLRQNGIEKLGPCITRGVLIDVAGLKGVESMAKGEVITPADIDACIVAAKIAPIGAGDAVIFHTGWGRHYGEPEVYSAGCPGIGIEAARYLVARNVALLAADTWPVDAIPGEDPEGVFDLHNFMQTVNGIWYLENLDNEPLAQMAADGVFEFVFVFVPVPFAGATGSPGDAIAIR